MAYSITTKDGITIDNIPDGIAPDAPELKQRVADLRASGGQPATPKPSLSNPETKAPTSGYVMGLRDPVDAGAQMLRRAVPEGVAKAIDNFGNWLSEKGLPVARSNGVEGVDQIVTDVNKQYDKQRGDAGVDVGRIAGNIVNPVNMAPGMALMRGANTLGSLALRGAAAGAMGGALQPVVDPGDDFAAKKAVQAGIGAVAGGVLTPAVSKVAERVVRGVQSASGSRAAPDIDVAMNNLFARQGINPADLNDSIRNSVRSQIDEAFRTRTRIDPAAIIRRAEFEAVGLSGDAAPTLGQVTRDPMQFAKEKNLSGINMDGQNELSARFQNQNQRLAGVFDRAGATSATDRGTAGDTLINALRQADEPVKQGVDDLYTAARNMSNGRVADLDRAAFSDAANTALDDGMLNAFVPSNVRGLLNDITAGKGPFNVESAVQIDSLLSKAQRQADRSGDSAGAFAIGKIRTALHDAPLVGSGPGAAAARSADDAGMSAAANAARTVDEGISDVPFREVPTRPELPSPGVNAVEAAKTPQFSQINSDLATAAPPAAAPIDEGQLARDAFDQARRAARNRFATIEDTPALKAALDEVAPDNFVKKFVLAADARDVAALRRVLANSPQAQEQARAQVADHLKRAAFGENPSGDKAFSADRYLKTLQSFGRQKLELFFSPDEVVRLNLAGKVASDINSIPVGARYGTNTSGTAAAAVNAITGILSKVPGGSLLGAPLNFLKNEAGTLRNQQAIRQALRAAPEQIAQPLPANVANALQLFATGSGAGGGAALAPTFE